jgi:hypothetical protein
MFLLNFCISSISFMNDNLQKIKQKLALKTQVCGKTLERKVVLVNFILRNLAPAVLLCIQETCTSNSVLKGYICHINITQAKLCLPSQHFSTNGTGDSFTKLTCILSVVDSSVGRALSFSHEGPWFKSR